MRTQLTWAQVHIWLNYKKKKWSPKVKVFQRAAGKPERGKILFNLNFSLSFILPCQPQFLPKVTILTQRQQIWPKSPNDVQSQQLFPFNPLLLFAMLTRNYIFDQKVTKMTKIRKNYQKVTMLFNLNFSLLLMPCCRPAQSVCGNWSQQQN